MGVDLNLLVPLDALLQERSVTRAAQRLGLSQPTVSAALARLRRHFGDELLTRVGNQYELTPLAEHLASHAKRTLDSANRVFDTRPDFDPAIAEREFNLIVTDVQLATFGRVLTGQVANRRPRTTPGPGNPEREFDSRHPLHDETRGQWPGVCGCHGPSGAFTPPRAQRSGTRRARAPG
ncbi:LysR family transcriptional regulator [Streptomyces capitiformicae]|uniref:HTH lysR-type domain-containing protein n=1 Tax=Streptomyces capitiformicae TaxID=2014920 RepID=A0A918ZXM6_9ACTN|nr:LysR family transcriptional regulator [Streptomyces capitiformicae]GHE73358.1 hypothetical protein GCM10017771_97070 [Streptomyces capitiformicae]